MIRQITATVYIIEDNCILLIYHKKFKKWLPPGGHLEPGELPPDGAIREAKEETGLDIELLPQENVWIQKQRNARSFERPYMCLLEYIPKHDEYPEHEHMDFIYIGKPIGGRLRRNKDETDGLRWFSFRELEKLERGSEIFDETYQTILHLQKQDTKSTCSEILNRFL